MSDVNSYFGIGMFSRRRALADAAGGVVLRAVARAEPAVVVALLAERHAAEVGADLDHHEPGFLARRRRGSRRSPARRRAGCRCARVGSRSSRDVHGLGRRRSPCRRALADDDRLAAPLDDERLARLDGRDVDLDRGQRQRRRVRVHLVDERPGDQAPRRPRRRRRWRCRGSRGASAPDDRPYRCLPK